MFKTIAFSVAALGFAQIAAAQTLSEPISVGGALTSPVGSMMSISVSIDTRNGGAGAAFVSVPMENSSFSKIGNGPMEVSASDLQVTGGVSAAGNGFSQVNVSRTFAPAPEPAAVFERVGNGSFQTPSFPGSADITVSSSDSPPSPFVTQSDPFKVFENTSFIAPLPSPATNSGSFQAPSPAPVTNNFIAGGSVFPAQATSFSNTSFSSSGFFSDAGSSFFSPAPSFGGTSFSTGGFFSGF
jgi:hypothetical protein